MAFRPIPILHAFLDNTGQPLDGGSVEFYEAGTTTPLDVYSDSALSANIGSTLALDASGRLSVYPWAGESCYIVVKDADGVVVDEADDVAEQGAAVLSFPSQTGHSGEFLTTDGTNLAFDAILQVPDPTGNANKILGTDGTTVSWIAKPADGADASNVSGTATTLKIGTTLFQAGTGSFVATGAQSASASVTFPTAFTTAPKVVLQLNGSTMYLPHRIDSTSLTGFTASCDSNLVGENVVIDQPFTYFAIGPVAA